MKVIVNQKEIELIDANHFFIKLKGFMFKKNINICLRFKTGLIHTMFMKEFIDIIMTTKDNKVLYIFKNVPKNKFILKRQIYYTYEFPGNFIEEPITKFEVIN